MDAKQKAKEALGRLYDDICMWEEWPVGLTLHKLSLKYLPGADFNNEGQELLRKHTKFTSWRHLEGVAYGRHHSLSQQVALIQKVLGDLVNLLAGR